MKKEIVLYLVVPCYNEEEVLNITGKVLYEKMNSLIEKKLLLINDKVNERLDVNFEKTNKTFNNILERLTKIDFKKK